MQKRSWCNYLFYSLFTVLLLSGCGGGSTSGFGSVVTNRDGNVVPDALRPNVLDENLQAFVNQAAPRSSNMGMIFSVPHMNYRYVDARGVANAQSGGLMSSSTPFRTASMSKTFTATVVLQLIEEGYFSLDSQLGELLNSAIFPAGYNVDDLHVRSGVQSGASITIRQLLQHTAGLRDYIADTPYTQDGFGLFAQAMDDLQHNNRNGLASRQWRPEALLAHYLQSGLAARALAAPGQAFEYSDTHYLLLGLVIEQVTGQSLSSNYRGRIFSRIGMANTWHEDFEADQGRVAQHFYRSSSHHNLELASSRLNMSLVWASGAVVSTLEDLENFMQALVNGRLFHQQATLQYMQQQSLGVQKQNLAGQQVWGHAGFWGGIMLYVPQQQSYLLLMQSQAGVDMFQQAAQVLREIDGVGL